MLSAVLCSCAGGAALLYALYRWIVPAVAQHHAGLALIWHDVIVERLLDTLTRSTRPQVRVLSPLFPLAPPPNLSQMAAAWTPLCFANPTFHL